MNNKELLGLIKTRVCLNKVNNCLKNGNSI
jgi:hypothetical protein